MSHKNILQFAVLGATALSIVACGEAEEEILAYESVEACIAAGQQDAAVCSAEFAKAQKLHNEVAPSYDAASDCYSDFGYNRCNQYRRPNGTSVWLPFMMGYMLAPRGGTSIMSTQPLYRTTSDPNRYYTAGTGRVGTVSGDGRARVAKSQVSRPPVRTRTVARGGFGARAWGGGRSAGS
jgi:uncharacterized protein YgiB involved in biofilm formation